jgi:hypothetical protein
MLKKLMLGAAASALALSGALAQSQPAKPAAAPAAQSQAAAPSSSAKVQPSADAKFVGSQKSGQWVASKFKGTDVLGSDDQKIGDISDILFDKSGKIEAFVVSVGGFLGVGSKEVALAPDAFTVVPGQNGSAEKLKVAMTKDQLKAAEHFARYEPPRARPATTGSGGMGSGLGGPRPSTNR